jgi:bacterioferritin-associated ferredoxin
MQLGVGAGCGRCRQCAAAVLEEARQVEGSLAGA